MKSLPRSLLALPLLLSLALAPGCKRTEGGSCEYWVSKLTSETDELAAVKGLVDQKCDGASEALAGRLPESRVPGEVVAALGALPPTDAARDALRKAVSDGRIGEAAAKVLVAWEDAGALDALRAALGAPGAEHRRGELLEAALALTGGDPAPLLPALGALVAADPAEHGMDTARRAARLLAEGAAAAGAEDRAALSAQVAAAALRPSLRADAEIASALRLALARLGLADPAPLVAGLTEEDPASPLVAELLWDAGAGTPALAAHLAATLRREDVAAPRRLTDVATAALVLAPADGAELVPLLTEAPHRSLEVATALGLLGQAAPLWDRFAAATGAARASLVPALALAMGPGDLERWKKDVQGSASALVRELAEDVTTRERVALLEACPEPACVVAKLRELTGELGSLGAALAQARTAWDQARKAADEELAKLAEAFKSGGGEGDRAEMERLRARRDELYAPVTELRRALDEHVAVRERALRALVTLIRAEQPPAEAWDAVKAVWEAAQGEELADVRLWAAVALERLATRDHAAALRALAQAHPDEPTATHLLAVATRL